eukprot:Hpha_TRINITY_DN5742_c0_g1::TRINITY_DN5742_c0_g1_i1::g.147559::m.147559
MSAGSIRGAIVPTPPPPVPPFRLRKVLDSELRDFKSSMRGSARLRGRPFSARSAASNGESPRYAALADALPQSAREWLVSSVPEGTAVIFYKTKPQHPSLATPRSTRFGPVPALRGPRMPSAERRRPRSARAIEADGKYLKVALQRAEDLLKQQQEEVGSDTGKWFPFRAKLEAEGTADAHQFLLRSVPRECALESHGLLLLLRSVQRLQKAAGGLSVASCERARRACLESVTGKSRALSAAPPPLTLKGFHSALSAVGAAAPVPTHGADSCASWDTLYHAFDGGVGTVDPLRFARALTISAGRPARRSAGLVDLFLSCLRTAETPLFLLELHGLTSTFERLAQDASREEASEPGGRFSSAIRRGAEMAGTPAAAALCSELPPLEALTLAELRSIPSRVSHTGGEMSAGTVLTVVLADCPTIATAARGLPDLGAAIEAIESQQEADRIADAAMAD